MMELNALGLFPVVARLEHLRWTADELSIA
ncbi:hypothetical protein FHS42_006390 [Streptomyces zagrosensis]|uniref:Uncharacterized protein n=1 Tax=Streptomyces zagrosensis TaxID=1042984 RepID=A0A7W9QHF7_9ACTN|nr:hypothetical protein [Streptomyces zagrosensis]